MCCWMDEFTWEMKDSKCFIETNILLLGMCVSLWLYFHRNRHEMTIRSDKVEYKKGNLQTTTIPTLFLDNSYI